MARRILIKWRRQIMENGGFLKHINGNVLDNHIPNLCLVRLDDALHNIDDWTVDWSARLSDKQTDLVMEEPDTFIELTESWHGH